MKQDVLSYYSALTYSKAKQSVLWHCCCISVPSAADNVQNKICQNNLYTRTYALMQVYV